MFVDDMAQMEENVPGCDSHSNCFTIWSLILRAQTRAGRMNTRRQQKGH